MARVTRRDNVNVLVIYTTDTANGSGLVITSLTRSSQYGARHRARQRQRTDTDVVVSAVSRAVILGYVRVVLSSYLYGVTPYELRCLVSAGSAAAAQHSGTARGATATRWCRSDGARDRVYSPHYDR